MRVLRALLLPTPLPLIAALTSSGLVFAQTPDRSLRTGEECSNCVIEKVIIFEVNDASAPGALPEYATADVLRDGRALVISGAGRELWLADRKSGLRQVGRRGKGPGEYMNISFVAESDSFVAVFDNRSGRITFLDKGRLRPVRTATLPLLPHDNPIPISGNVFAFPTKGTSGEPVVALVDGVGRTLRLLRPQPAVGTKSTAPVIASSRDGGLWVIDPYGYRVEKWTIEGRRSDAFTGSFQSTGAANGPRAKAADDLRIISAHEDRDGRLWIEILALPKPQRQPGQVIEPSGHKNTRTFVEVIDPLKAAVLKRQVFRGGFSASGAGQFHSTFLVSPNGEPVVQVWMYRFGRQ